ncbi:MAG TPA: hypothetical protein VIL86_17810 [Tepidisphaeraceae bacterium]|jgi:hypothetical protein
MAKAAPKDLLAKLEQEDREARLGFEAQRRAAREKALVSIVEPLKKEREQVEGQMRQLRAQANEIERELAALTGKSARGDGRKRRHRLGNAEKLSMMELVFAKMSKSRGQRFEPVRLKESLDGYGVSEMVGLWNAAHKGDEKISHEGGRANRRYFVA